MADDAQLISAAQEVIPLWPEGPPDPLPAGPPELTFPGPVPGRITTMLRNVSDPTMTVFSPKAGTSNGLGVIVVPGGGWRILAWEHEGVDVAHWLAERGYTAFLLKYRVMATAESMEDFMAEMAWITEAHAAPRLAAQAPRSIMELASDETSPLAMAAAATDGRKAISIVRERAKDWGVDPAKIGMIGFSAGAFLTVDVSVDAGGVEPLAWAAPIYGGETRGKPVPADAPPLFTVIAQDDRLLYKVVEGLYTDWSNADRPAEFHLFRRGAHGFGMCKQGFPSDRWIDLFEAWLKDLGFS